MSKNALVVIALKGFQDVELAGVLKGLESTGYHYTLCGKEKKKDCIGKFGGHQATTIAMRDVNPNDYDRIAFIGGPGARALADDEEALHLAKAFHSAHKIIGAICIAPLILTQAGLLKGKRATIWDSEGGKGPEAKILKEHHVNFVPEMPVVVDLPFVTGNGPNAADEFGRVFAMVEN